jgi:multidrug efflux pump subunit AcrA (membrane-fusion protein)
MFGRAQVPASAPYDALLLPDAAIGTEQARKYVLVVGEDNTAEQRYVTLGPIADGYRVVKTGLKPEDRVVINGLIRARVGGKLSPEEVSPPVQASAPGPQSE